VSTERIPSSDPTALHTTRLGSLFSDRALASTKSGSRSPRRLPGVMLQEARSPWRRNVCIIAALVLATLCNCAEDEGPLPHPCKLVQPVSCPTYSCGQSARVYNSYVDALDTRGEQLQDSFPEGFRILRNSLVDAGGGCRDVPRLSLEVRDGGFVGVIGDPQHSTVLCSGDALVGARFRLEQISSEFGLRIATVTIAERGTVNTVYGPSETLPTYNLVVDGVPDFAPGSFCNKGRWINETEPVTMNALLIQGETYGPDAGVTERGDHWVNIGCAGSAIAKMRLHGMDPMKNKISGTPEENRGRSTPDERQAALKMLTGMYCGAITWTENDTQIFWLGAGEGAVLGVGEGAVIPLHGLPPLGQTPIEARWGVNGALCISHLRLWSQGSECAKQSEQQWVEMVQRRCGIPACAEPAASCLAQSADTGDGTIWRTCTANHIGHTPGRPDAPPVDPLVGPGRPRP
jgi:hypothetical protein